MRTVILGADGLAFRILHPLIERGDLPNFKRLSEQGCEAILESKYPPLTPAAWISLSTGLKPARHGVYDFWMYEDDSRIPRVQTKRKGGKAIWNILSEYGKQVLVINVPMTYPPEPVNGIMVSGYMTPSDQGEFTYPASFKEELYQAAPGYQIDLDLEGFFRQSNALDKLIDVTLDMTEKRIQLLSYMLKEKPWDFCYVAFVGPDRLQHSLWKELISLDPRATEYFRLLDKALGLLLDYVGDDGSLYIISDHGFQGVNYTFSINEYLRLKGLLVPGSLDSIKRAGLKADVKDVLKRVGLFSLARRVKKFLKHSGAVKFDSHTDVYQPLEEKIDLERTVAYVPSQSGYPGSFVDIVFKKDTPPEVVAEVAEDLKTQINPFTNGPLVDAVYTNEAFGEGPFARKEPHLLVLPNDSITFRMDIGGKHVWNETTQVRGTHQKDGVFYAYGPNIKKGFKAPNAEVFDVVPTVLQGMGLPLPLTFDGRVVEDIFIQPKPDEQSATTQSKGGLARRKLKKLLEV
ncbi:hypothetical protein EPA93_41050 [Ktedonosporobacter rubrisoli]|uniref:Phosphodiesterase n=1 Tax=Ktedonosporobacter rubrisoli TaxID=2509675 RepID=A0A4P6K1Q2_KTERU|nr:alkaline phosphatase family protein [Ktedonosporobacter rubrisoli]QBD82029.1 hypothetical protein EPA93_41050 [Ktedonosporobacter rubrisoli]